MDLHEIAARFYRDQVTGSWARSYLARRGLGDQAPARWRIGYAPASWTALTTHLRGLGHRDQDIVAAGLARRSRRGTLVDYFRDRVMLPVLAEDGAIAGWIGRARPDASAGIPKYLNSPRTAAYVKGDLLFGLFETRDQLARGAVPVLAEGPFDAIAVTLADPRQYAGIAPCGTALTSHQVAALARLADLGETGVIVALDGDRAGHDAAIRAYGTLSVVTSKAVAVLLPAGRDPAGIFQADGAAALRMILRQRTEPLARLVIDAHLDQWSRRLGEAEGQLGALRSAASLIASMLPSDTAVQILRVTSGRRLDPVDDNLRPVAHPELPQIARLLPVGPACQITRLAERLSIELSDVTAEVANALAADTSRMRRRAGPGGIRISQASAARACPAHLATADLPGPPLAGSDIAGRAPPRPGQTATRPASTSHLSHPHSQRGRP